MKKKYTKKYSIIDNHAAAKEVDTKNTLDDLVYYLGFYLTFKDNDNIPWEKALANDGSKYKYHSMRNRALTFLTKQIYSSEDIYISNTKAKRYLQTKRKKPVMSDTYLCFFVDNLFLEISLYPNLSSFIYDNIFSHCNNYTPEIDYDRQYCDCLHFIMGFQLELLRRRGNNEQNDKKRREIKECIKRIRESVHNNTVNERCRMRRGIKQEVK